MPNFREKISNGFSTHVEAPIRRLIIEKAFDFLGVKVDIHVKPEHVEMIQSQIEKVRSKDKQIIFVGLEHLDHLDSLVEVYFLLREFPQLLPYLTVVAAAEVWDNPKMKLIANFFLRSITLFKRSASELKAQLKKLKHLPQEAGKSVVILFAQPGRGQPIKKLPMSLAHEYGNALIVLCKITNPHPVFGKEPRSEESAQEPESAIIRHQISEAHQRRLNGEQQPVSLEVIEIISTHDEQGNSRSLREISEKFLALTQQHYPHLSPQKEVAQAL